MAIKYIDSDTSYEPNIFASVKNRDESQNSHLAYVPDQAGLNPASLPAVATWKGNTQATYCSSLA